MDHDVATATEGVEKEWREYIEPLIPIAEKVARQVPECADPQIRAEMMSFLFSQLGAGYWHLVAQDPAYPQFIPTWNTVFNNNGILNPDNTYYITPIDDDGVYQVSGHRGTVYNLDLQVGWSPMFAGGRRFPDDPTYGPSLAAYQIDDLNVAEDGYFSVIVSAERPEGYDGDWCHLPPTGDNLLLRQISYDWTNEICPRVSIERLDTPAAKPRQSKERIRERLARVSEWAENWMLMSTSGIPGTAPDRGMGAKDEFRYYPLKDQGGRLGQIYVERRYDIAPDEAFIVEMEPRDSSYWNVNLANVMWQTLDYEHRLTTFNGHTATADSDGKYRFVVSEQDPGVPNWLDNMGNNEGLFWVRVISEHEINPSAKVVPISEVRGHLPADTPTVSPAEREETIRERNRGFQLRRKW